VKQLGSYQCCAALYRKWNNSKSHDPGRSTNSWNTPQQIITRDGPFTPQTHWR